MLYIVHAETQVLGSEEQCQQQSISRKWCFRLKAIDENPVEIEFDGESWLIYGGNETKILLAIIAALFERPNEQRLRK